jgi:Fe-S-cluster containining protein
MNILKSADPVPTCRRCGECCLKGGPALHKGDLTLFEKGGPLDLGMVLTLRAGERIFDQVLGEIRPLQAEILKLKGPTPEAADWACRLYDRESRACALYDARPAECRALSCRDTADLAAMYDKDRVSRRDFFPAGHAVLAIMAEHEALVPVARIAILAEALRTGGQEALDAGEELARMALADQAFRKGLAERARISPDMHDFFLGRAASALFAAEGVALRPDARLGFRAQPDPLWRQT